MKLRNFSLAPPAFILLSLCSLLRWRLVLGGCLALPPRQLWRGISLLPAFRCPAVPAERAYPRWGPCGSVPSIHGACRFQALSPPHPPAPCSDMGLEGGDPTLFSHSSSSGLLLTENTCWLCGVPLVPPPSAAGPVRLSSPPRHLRPGPAVWGWSVPPACIPGSWGYFFIEFGCKCLWALVIDIWFCPFNVRIHTD